MTRPAPTARMRSVLLRPEDGDPSTTPDDRPARSLVDGRHTGGAFAATELVVSAGTAGTAYVHHEVDECFYAVEGEPSIEVDDREEAVRLRPGGLLYVPRGVARTVTNPGATPARLLVLQTPGRFPGESPRSGVELVGRPRA